MVAHASLFLQKYTDITGQPFPCFGKRRIIKFAITGIERVKVLWPIQITFNTDAVYLHRQLGGTLMLVLRFV